MNDTPSIRAFLAIEAPPEVLDAVVRVQSRLKKTVQGAIGWVRPAGMHLTVKFLGPVQRHDLDAIGEAAVRAVRDANPLELRVAGLGVFPDLNRPRVLWIGVTGDREELVALQRSVEQHLLPLGFSREQRPFRPHLTLARIKTPRGLIGLARALETEGDGSCGAFRADRMYLVQSDLTPQGAVYTRLATFPLGD